MPKLSFAQEMAEMERLVAAGRSNAAVLPAFVQRAVDVLEVEMARCKELKARQQAYLAEQMEVTARLEAAIRNGKACARRMRDVAVFVYGPYNARLVQFGIRPYRRSGQTVDRGLVLGAEPEPAVRPARAETQESREDGPSSGGNVHSGGAAYEAREAEVAAARAAVPPRRASEPACREDAERGREEVDSSRAKVRGAGADGRGRLKNLSKGPRRWRRGASLRSSTPFTESVSEVSREAAGPG